MRHATLAALLTAMLLAGCGGDDATDAQSTAPATTAASRAAAPTDRIDIKGFKFEPANATVRAGQKISLVNGDAAPHTLTEAPSSGKPLFDTGNVEGRQNGSFTVTKPGTYAFYCELHAFMKGELTVVP